MRRILAHAVQVHSHAAELEVQDRRDAFDTLDHAGRKRGEKQFGGIECVRAPGQVRIQDELRRLAFGLAAMGVDPPRAYVEGHLRFVAHLASPFEGNFDDCPSWRGSASERTAASRTNAPDHARHAGRPYAW